jgi:diamine N-acetyltransferase
VTGLILRAATAADVPALSALGRESFVDKFGHMYRPEDLAAFLAEMHSPAAVTAELAHAERRYRLAEIDGALAGYCKLAIPSTLGEHDSALRPIEIKQLYTAPGMTGQGIGAALTVWSGNDGAQRFYARYGFVKAADIEFWVGEQCDEEFLFALRL